MADPLTFPSLVSKDNDQNAVDNAIYVQLSDGTTAIGVTGNALDVNIDNASIVVTATQLDIDDLRAGIASGEDNVLIFANTVKDGTGIDYVPLVDTDGKLIISNPGGAEKIDDSAFVIATDSVSPSGYLADETTPDSVDEGDVGLARMTLDRKQLFVLVDEGTDANRLTINVNGEAEVNLQAHALTNTNALPISKDNNANSETNPIFVKNTDTVVSGSEIHDFDQAVAVAGLGTSNHDYTVVNTTALINSVIVSASGNAKFEIQTDNGGGFNTITVGFLTGREGDTKVIPFKPALEATTTVRIIRTNRQNQAQDLYSTIIGSDV